MDSLSSNKSFSFGTITESKEIKEHAHAQLTARGNKKVSTVVEYKFKQYEAWGLLDLQGLGTFKINNQVIYSTKNKANIPDDQTLVKEILVATNQNIDEALQYIKLLEQHTFGLAHSEVFNKFNLHETKVFKPLEKAAHLSVEGKTFKVTMEILGQLRDRNDPFGEDTKTYPITYVKMKTVVTGSRLDLSSKHDTISTKVMHTEQAKTEQAARKASYGGFWDFTQDAKSEISEKK